MRESGRNSVLIVATVVLVALGGGCRDDGVAVPEQRSAKAEQGEASSASDERFDTEVRPANLSVGEPTEVTFVLRAGEGLKTNRDYPSWSLELTTPSGIKLADESFSGQEITLADREATLTTKVTARKVGRVAIDGVANFSVCNDQTCHILRDESVRFTVQAE